MYFVFVLILIIMLLINYNLFKGDFMEPPVFLNALFVFSAVMAVYLYKFWHLDEYGGYTVFIFILGILSFSVGGLLARWFVFFSNKKNHNIIHPEGKWGRINIFQPILILIIFFSLFTLIYYVYYFINSVTISNLANMIADLKEIRTTEGLGLPSMLSNCIKMLGFIAHISLFVYLNNVVTGEQKRKDYILVLISFVYLFISFLSGNRGNMLMLCLAGVMAWYILYSRTHGWRRKNTKLIISKGVKIGLVVLFLFWLIMYITGGTKQHSSNENIILYLCGYICSPLAGFDLYLKQGELACNWWGEETFVALNNNLNSWFGMAEYSERYLEFRYTDEYSVTNIYSSFRRFYHDFQLLGVIVLPFLQGFITGKLYRIVKKKNTYKFTVDFSMCLYSYFFYTVLYTLVDDLFFSSNISFSGLAKMVLLYLCYRIMFYKATQNFALKTDDA